MDSKEREALIALIIRSLKAMPRDELARLFRHVRSPEVQRTKASVSQEGR